MRDDRGRVASATGPGFANGFGYDPRGIRVRRADSAGTHLFHLEGDRLEAVYDSGGALREQYLRGSVIDEVVNAYLFDESGKPTNLTYHHDPVTSVVALTGHAGTLEESISYTPFGAPLGASGASANTLRFTGRERDPDTGLYYFRARYYDPVIGRFLSEDPLGLAGGDVNFYTYAANNPLRFNDPKGQCPAGGLICAGLVIAAGGVIGVGVPAIISNTIDFFTGASPEKTAASNAAFLGAAKIVGGTALVPTLLGGGIAMVPVATTVALAHPEATTEFAEGVATRVLGGPDFKQPTLSIPTIAGEELTSLTLDTVHEFGESLAASPPQPSSFDLTNPNGSSPQSFDLSGPNVPQPLPFEFPSQSVPQPLSDAFCLKCF